jgi:multidrug transporter EmrE-like cation transporter
MLFAIPIAARRNGVRLGPREWASVAAVVAGLGIGIGLASPREGNPLAPTISEWAWALGAVGLITLAVVGLTLVISGTARASLFALAGATTLALQSALFDTSIRLLSKERFGVFTHWQAYALIVVSLLGLWLIQQAYKAGPLPASLPIIDAVLPIGAIALGMGLFDETINTRWWGLAGASVGLTLLIVGILSLDTSGAVRKQQKIEDQKQKEQAGNDGSGDEERAEARHRP